tara:strand:+ start:5744 stop:7081 length:1338 start_codon:yes stop_codon:yes gene_type:complete
MKAANIPYSSDSSTLALQLHKLPDFIWLDNGDGKQGRYDILTAQPFMTITTWTKQTFVQIGDDISPTNDDPFHLLKHYLQHFARDNDTDLPFTGGAMGYLSYDMARYVEELPELTQSDISLPNMRMGIYDWAIVVDHELKQTQFVYHEGLSDIDHTAILATLEQPVENDLHYELTSPFQANMNQAAYHSAFNKIQQYILDGDCYEMNFSQRFSATAKGSPLAAYLHLRENINPSFSAFIQGNDYAVLSLSPERFLKVSNNHVETKPIKGTRPRGETPEQDQALIDELKNSEKDQAENLMIVDLLRHDLGKVCNTGSIKVEKLFDVETFANVHHLVSTITGELDDKHHSIDLLRACFPGGSITGAPKVRAMQIIEELEPQRRSLYCGSIGYIDFNGNMDMNIAIRSLIWDKDNLHCSTGGAIVADSTWEAEYQETLDKISNLLRTL